MWKRQQQGIIALLLWLPLSVLAADKLDRPAETAQRLSDLRKAISQIQTQMQTTQNQRNQVSQKLQQSEVTMSRLQREWQDITERYNATQQRLIQLQMQAQQQQVTLQQERDTLVKQIRSAYRMGRQQQIKLLLSQQDTQIFSRMLNYYDYLNRARIAGMQTAEQTLQQLIQTQRDIVQQQEQLLTLQEQQQSTRQNLQIAQQQRRQVLTQLDQQLQQQGTALQRLQADAEQLQTLLNQLQQVLADRTAQQQIEPFSHKRGQLKWPTQGRILHRFGSRKIGSLRWDGVLMQATVGQAVRASYAGQVVFADWLRGFGLLLIVDHGEGYLSLYGHNQHLLKRVGDQVVANEPIAQAGKTGGQRHAGLYFAIRHQGQPVDPAEWCRR
jgi:septal ring factor EnvC (AmiA/AmiB activator)